MATRRNSHSKIPVSSKSRSRSRSSKPNYESIKDREAFQETGIGEGIDENTMFELEKALAICMASDSEKSFSSNTEDNLMDNYGVKPNQSFIENTIEQMSFSSELLMQSNAHNNSHPESEQSAMDGIVSEALVSTENHPEVDINNNYIYLEEDTDLNSNNKSNRYKEEKDLNIIISKGNETLPTVTLSPSPLKSHHLPMNQQTDLPVGKMLTSVLHQAFQKSRKTKPMLSKQSYKFSIKSLHNFNNQEIGELPIPMPEDISENDQDVDQISAETQPALASFFNAIRPDALESEFINSLYDYGCRMVSGGLEYLNMFVGDESDLAPRLDTISYNGYKLICEGRGLLLREIKTNCNFAGSEFRIIVKIAIVSGDPMFYTTKHEDHSWTLDYNKGAEFESRIEIHVPLGVLSNSVTCWVENCSFYIGGY